MMPLPKNPGNNYDNSENRRQNVDASPFIKRRMNMVTPL